MKKFFDPISGEVHARNVSVGLQSLDEVDLREVFKRRAVVMKSVSLSCEVSAGGPRRARDH